MRTEIELAFGLVALFRRRVPAYPALDIGRAHCARLARDLAAVREHHERRDAANAEARGDILLCFRVQLQHAGVAAERGRRALELGRHHPAGSAPLGPEIDDDRDVVAGDVLLERGARNLVRLAVEQGAMTLSALRALAEAVGRDAVHREAMRTNDVARVAHGLSRGSARRLMLLMRAGSAGIKLERRQRND